MRGYGDRNSIGGAGGPLASHAHAATDHQKRCFLCFACSTSWRGNSRFRILERGGAMVGNYETYRSPFIVEAIKLSHVLVLDAPTVLAQMPAADAATVKAAITRQLQPSIEALTGNRRKSAFLPSAQWKKQHERCRGTTAGSPLMWITTTGKVQGFCRVHHRIVCYELLKVSLERTD